MMRMKQLAWVSLLMVAAPVFASNGFYLGLGVGPDATDFNRTSRVVVSVEPPIVTSNVKDKTHLSGTGVFGNLFGGYGYAWSNHFYLAGELNASMSSAAAESSNTEYVSNTTANTVYKMENVFGVSLLPGYLYKEIVLFYARLGYASGNFVSSTSDVSLADVNRRLNGIRYGLGINASVMPNLGARLEYNQTHYAPTQFTATPAFVTKTTQVTPTTNQVEFSLVYNFA